MSNEFRRYTIILNLLFSGFSNPKESRFVKFFSNDSSQSDDSTSSKKSAYKSLNIKSVNIENGKDSIYYMDGLDDPVWQEYHNPYWVPDDVYTPSINLAK